MRIKHKHGFIFAAAEWQKIFLVIAMLAIQGCDGKGPADGQYKVVWARAQQYYKLEQQKEWIKTYEYRTPSFRMAVSLEDYRKRMATDDKGWRLEKIEREGAAMVGKKVHLKIGFRQLVPGRYLKQVLSADLLREYQRRHKKPEMVFHEESVWQEVNGTWYCADAAYRGHLPMNNDLAPED
jgi:hypothetical protein